MKLFSKRENEKKKKAHDLFGTKSNDFFEEFFGGDTEFDKEARRMWEEDHLARAVSVDYEEEFKKTGMSREEWEDKIKRKRELEEHEEEYRRQAIAESKFLESHPDCEC